MQAHDLKLEFMRDPLGIDLTAPLLSWILTADARNSRQTAYQLQVYAEIAENQRSLIYDSGVISDDRSSMTLRKLAFESATRYWWRVRVWDEGHEPGAWSDFAYFETGLLEEKDWADAQWAEPEQESEPLIAQEEVNFERLYPELHDEDRLVPTLILKRRFQAGREIWKARAYVSAHGVYQLSINGRRAGKYELAPEVSSYDKYLQYQTYDITDAVKLGENVAAIHLAPGWWSGIIGLHSASCQYGKKMAAIVKLVIFYRDGSRESFCSDETMTAEQGPCRYAELYVGEYFDSNLALRSGAPRAVRFPAYDKACLRGQNAPHIRVIKKIPCKRQLISPKGQTILDFGEVLAGKARLVMRAHKGATVKLHHFQQLDEFGNYFLGVTNDYNQMTDTYVFHSDAAETYEPTFVYRGFRYIWVDGDVQVCLRKTKALLMSTVEAAGSFECSDDRVTKLAENVQRTALANYMAVPTDNPDRERAGWTGDAQMFFEAGSYCADTRAFWRRWIEQMRLEQAPNGNIPLIVPNWKSYERLHAGPFPSSSAWGDACILIPWMYYQQYGDLRILEENYEMMQKWLHLVQHTAENYDPDAPESLTAEEQARRKYLWNAGFHFGDWLTPSDCTDENGQFQYKPNTLPLQAFTPLCYYGYTTQLMSQIAELLGDRAESERYRALSEKIKEAAFEALFDETGVPYEDRQGALVLGVQFELLPEALRDQALQRLIQKIEENGGRMDTGFTSTQYLLDTLTEHGYVKDAYDRLFCNTPPSWLYEVEKGATAIWESWQAIMPNGHVNPVSFIQYANGVVGAWLYKTVAGIRPAEPGYRKILIAPKPDARLRYARASYDTPQGTVQTGWYRSEEGMTLDAVLPANTQATIVLPDARLNEVYESGMPVTESLDFCSTAQSGSNVLVKCGSGSYRFTYKLH